VLEPTAPPLIAECRLDIDGLCRQRDRYRALGAHAASARRQQQRLEVHFDAGVDVDLLAEAIDVERRCCPFFEMRLQLERRELVITVPHPERIRPWTPSPPRSTCPIPRRAELGSRSDVVGLAASTRLHTARSRSHRAPSDVDRRPDQGEDRAARPERPVRPMQSDRGRTPAVARDATARS
jgi:hypothetical protein